MDAIKKMRIYDLKLDYKANIAFWTWMDYDEDYEIYFQSAKKAKDYIINVMLKAFEEDDALYLDVADNKEDAIKWWFKYHISILEKDLMIY